MKVYFGLCIILGLSINHGKSEPSPEIKKIEYKKTIQQRGQLNTITENYPEPVIVPDPEDGGRWWYAPSPRAELYRHKYSHLLQHEMQSRENENLRLPRDLVPVIYNIRLLPFIEEGNFTTKGHIDIFVDCVKNTSSINMNSAAIDVDRFSITVENIATNNILEVSEFIDDQQTREMIEIKTTNQLVEGNRYKISIDFVSYLNDELRGFYRSSYMENGVRKWLAVTQFEAPDARRAFPCFDEPSLKAEFTVSLGRKKTMSSASNMLLLSTYQMEGHPDYVWDQYQTTVKMPTYLVAFLVSEFVAVPAASGHRVPFRLWVKPESQHLAAYSLKVGPAMQEFYEDYFKIPYPLPKQDLAAIPDFDAGAMENWGLITYRETRLLIDLEKDTRSLRQSIAAINAHEIAHQWFGNLVTTDWWNTIWLNEGFATYVEFLGTEAVEPGLRYMDQFANIELQYVFGIDALETSRPISQNVTTPSEISRMFDGISYDKGACIIRMCANFIGLETFNRGLTRYLNARSYKNAVQDDLWLALQEQTEEEGVALPATVKEIMDTWTLQMGFPLITITRNYDDWSATVSQSRFLLRKDPDSTDDHVYRWWVPLTFHSPSNTTEKFYWMSDAQDSITIQDIEAFPNEWVIFNVDQKNVYRVAYDQLNYQLLAKQLLTDHRVIMDNNRAQLLDDAFVLASVEVIPYKLALNLFAYLKNEVEWAPWNAVLGELNYIDNMLYSSIYHVDWQNYLVGLVTPYYNHVGFQESPTDAHLTVYSRSDAINWACRLRIADCVTNIKEKYAAFMADPSNESILSPNQKSLILNYGVELGGVTEWSFAFEHYDNGDGAFLVPITKTRQINLLYQQLEWMLNGTIRRADVGTLFNNIAANPVGNKIATSFLVNRWADIEAAFGNDYFAAFFRYLCDRKNTQAELDELINLRDSHSDVLGTSNTVKQGIEIIQSNIKWMEANPAEIAVWLGLIHEVPTAAPPTTTRTLETTTVYPTTVYPTTIAPTTKSTTPSTTSTQLNGSSPALSKNSITSVLLSFIVLLICRN